MASALAYSRKKLLFRGDARIKPALIRFGEEVARINGVTLRSYDYAWAERALKCGYPERFAQQALGLNCKAVYRAYSKNAEVTVPSLDDWEEQWNQNPPRSGIQSLLAECLVLSAMRRTLPCHTARNCMFDVTGE